MFDNKIKRLVLVNVPVTACNFRCAYCYITQQKRWGDKVEPFNFSALEVRRALSVSRLGGRCLVILCAAGETLLAPELPSLVKELLEEGHYVEVVTNGTISKRIDEILETSSGLLSNLTFKLSFHYEELLRLNNLDLFFENATRLKSSGCSITVEMTTFDDLLTIKDEIKSLCLTRLGAVCHLTVGRDDADPNVPILTHYPLDEYKKAWSVFSSPMLDFKLSTYYVKRKEFCYAGDWSFYLDLRTGFARQCYKSKVSQNIFDNPSSPIKFCAIGKSCLEPHCYNSHSLLTFGTIPSLKTPTYSVMRNRICADGTEWLKSNMKEFYSSRLYNSNSNKEYGTIKKALTPFMNKYFSTYFSAMRLKTRAMNKVTKWMNS